MAMSRSISSNKEENCLRLTSSGITSIKKYEIDETRCTSLFASYNLITNLANIGQFKFVTTVLLEYNEISYIEDLLPLASLVRLTFLSLIGNPVCRLPLWDIHIRAICQHLKFLNGSPISSLSYGNCSRQKLFSIIDEESKLIEAAFFANFTSEVLTIIQSDPEISDRSARSKASRPSRKEFAQSIRLPAAGFTAQGYFAYIKQLLIKKHAELNEKASAFWPERAKAHRAVLNDASRQMNLALFIRSAKELSDSALAIIGFGAHGGEEIKSGKQDDEEYYRSQRTSASHPIIPLENDDLSDGKAQFVDSEDGSIHSARVIKTSERLIKGRSIQSVASTEFLADEGSSKGDSSTAEPPALRKLDELASTDSVCFRAQSNMQSKQKKMTKMSSYVNQKPKKSLCNKDSNHMIAAPKDEMHFNDTSSTEDTNHIVEKKGADIESLGSLPGEAEDGTISFNKQLYGQPEHLAEINANSTTETKASGLTGDGLISHELEKNSSADNETRPILSYPQHMEKEIMSQQSLELEDKFKDIETNASNRIPIADNRIPENDNNMAANAGESNSEAYITTSSKSISKTIKEIRGLSSSDGQNDMKSDIDFAKIETESGKSDKGSSSAANSGICKADGNPNDQFQKDNDLLASDSGNLLTSPISDEGISTPHPELIEQNSSQGQIVNKLPEKADAFGSKQLSQIQSGDGQTSKPLVSSSDGQNDMKSDSEVTKIGKVTLPKVEFKIKNQNATEQAKIAALSEGRSDVFLSPEPRTEVVHKLGIEEASSSDSQDAFIKPELIQDRQKYENDGVKHGITQTRIQNIVDIKSADLLSSQGYSTEQFNEPKKPIETKDVARITPNVPINSTEKSAGVITNQAIQLNGTQKLSNILGKPEVASDSKSSSPSSTQMYQVELQKPPYSKEKSKAEGQVPFTDDDKQIRIINSQDSSYEVGHASTIEPAINAEDGLAKPDFGQSSSKFVPKSILRSGKDLPKKAPEERAVQFGLPQTNAREVLLNGRTTQERAFAVWKLKFKVSIKRRKICEHALPLSEFERESQERWERMTERRLLMRQIEQQKAINDSMRTRLRQLSREAESVAALSASLCAGSYALPRLQSK